MVRSRKARLNTLTPDQRAVALELAALRLGRDGLSPRTYARLLRDKTAELFNARVHGKPPSLIRADVTIGEHDYTLRSWYEQHDLCWSPMIEVRLKP